MMMPRTTINLDATILRELKQLQRKEDKPLGEMVSELLSEALAERRSRKGRTHAFRWIARLMGAKLDLRDKDELWRRLDGPGRNEQ